MSGDSATHLLSVDRLSVAFRMYDPHAPYFRAHRILSPVLRELTFHIDGGEVLAIVGASGSGKTVLADSLLGIFEPNAEVTGRIAFSGRLMDSAALRSLRGREISRIPQGIDALDPLMPVGRQVLGVPKGASRSERQADAVRRRGLLPALFARYGFPPEVADLYPHELSGGMARRILLMCALMDGARLLIADEPTPGLDEELVDRALSDLRSVADEGGAVLLITHDIAQALRVADRIAVFRDGTIIETTDREAWTAPDGLAHPYSRALRDAIPENDFTVSLEVGR